MNGGLSGNDTNTLIERDYIGTMQRTLTGTDPLPAIGANIQTAHPGHVLVDMNTGIHFQNLGTAANTRYTDLFSNRFFLEERFKQKPALNAVLDTTGASSSAALIAYTIANKDFEVLGTNMTTALATFADGGGITLTTATGNNDQAIVTPHLDTNQSSWAAAKWNTEDEISFETVIKTGAAITVAAIWAGFKLTNTSVTATDDDQAFFRYSAAAQAGGTAAVWECCNSNTGTDQIQSSGITVAISTSYHLLIRVGTDRVPKYYIDRKLVATGNALKADTDLIPYIGVQVVSGGVAKAITVRALRCAKTLND
jgi:hypothetical protein